MPYTGCVCISAFVREKAAIGSALCLLEPGATEATSWRANLLVLKHQCETTMSRLTITLTEARYKALKEAAVQRDKTIGQLIDESLDFYGIKSRADARDLVRRARTRSKLPDDQALAVAQEHVVAARRKP
jgi:hypothetical protein